MWSPEGDRCPFCWFTSPGRWTSAGTPPWPQPTPFLTRSIGEPPLCASRPKVASWHWVNGAISARWISGHMNSLPIGDGCRSGVIGGESTMGRDLFAHGGVVDHPPRYLGDLLPQVPSLNGKIPMGSCPETKRPAAYCVADFFLAQSGRYNDVLNFLGRFTFHSVSNVRAFIKSCFQ